MKKILNLTKDQLEYYYIDLRMSMKDIGCLFDCSAGTIFNLIHRFNISPRTNSQAQIGHKCWAKGLTKETDSRIKNRISKMTMIQCEQRSWRVKKEWKNDPERIERMSGPNNWNWKGGPKSIPMNKNDECTLWLGVCVAESLLSNIFENVQRMPHGNKGFDFYCSKKYKIDAKSSCIRYNKSYKNSQYWMFIISKNVTADYFACIAFDNREDLNPIHFWLIPGYLINSLTGLTIYNSEKSLNKWLQYEQPLNKVLDCCVKMKQTAQELVK
jgi:hypothetical protein